jgi:AhpD family alkylhydroperoxidase
MTVNTVASSTTRVKKESYVTAIRTEQLTKTEQELIAIGSSVGAGCQPCLEYHLSEGAQAGLSKAELLQALADAECVKRSAYNEVAVRGRELLAVAADLPPACCDDTSVMKEFVSVGSAIGANSLAQLRKHIEQARGVGISSVQLSQAIEIARNVQQHAAEGTLKEATRLATAVTAPDAPVFLSETFQGATDQSCGPDCDCNALGEQANAAEACFEAEDALPVIQATQTGKCC